MEWRYEKQSDHIENAEYFDLEQTFECGQCFRWKRLKNGNWLGIVRGLVVEAENAGRNIIFHNMSPSEFVDVWHGYFDLGRDYGAVNGSFLRMIQLWKAIAFAPGIRVLRQDFYETLISFIISQNNNIPRIKELSACENYGTGSIQEHILYNSGSKGAEFTDRGIPGMHQGRLQVKIYHPCSQRVLELDIDTLCSMDSKGVRQELLSFTAWARKWRIASDCTADLCRMPSQ